MKIENVNNPATPSINKPEPASQRSQSARERAISALLGNQNPEPVTTAASLSPEDMSAVIPKAKAPESIEQPEQKHLNEESVETPSVESKAETEAKTEEEEPLSSQYAILARKEKAIRQREQQLKAREAALKSQEEAKAPAPAPKEPSLDLSKYVDKERLAKDPFSVLTEMGLTYDQLTELALNGPKPEQIQVNNEIAALKAELAALKSESASTKKTFEDAQTQSYNQAIAQITNEAKTLVNNNPNFETIKETGSVGDVVDLIKQTYEQDGILLTVEDAAQQVEDYLLEEALKLAKIKKIQQRLMPQAPKAEAPKATDQPKQSQPLKTLTNSVSTSRTLSARERALLAFEGKLK